MKLSWPLKSGYNIQGENDKVVIVEENGTERELGPNEKIDEENVVVAGNHAKTIKRNCTWDRINPFYLSKVTGTEKK